MTRKFTAGIFLGALCLAMAVETVKAEEETLSADLTVGAYSQYIWRGFAFSKDSLVIQPGFTMSYNGFGFNLWGNLDSDQWDKSSESFNWNETDMTISYDGAVGIVGYSTGYIYYDLDEDEDTEEIYVGVSVDTLLSPSLTVYFDIANATGWYANLGVSHSVAFGEKMSLDLGASIGYLDDDANYNELHDGVLSAALAIAITDNLTVSPEFYASFPLSSNAESYLEDENGGVLPSDESYNEDDPDPGYIDKREATFVYVGVSASLSF